MLLPNAQSPQPTFPLIPLILKGTFPDPFYQGLTIIPLRGAQDIAATPRYNMSMSVGVYGECCSRHKSLLEVFHPEFRQSLAHLIMAVNSTCLSHPESFVVRT